MEDEEEDLYSFVRVGDILSPSRMFLAPFTTGKWIHFLSPFCGAGDLEAANLQQISVAEFSECFGSFFR
jgi:hypothetical protein